MKELVKTIEDYKSWKSEIRKVLDDNFKDIVSLLIDAYGQDELVPFKSEQPVLNQFNQFNQNNNPVLVTGFVANIDQLTGEYLLWFYEKGSFYLIQRNSESKLLNIRPNFFDQSRTFFNSPAYKANFENEINFVLELIEHSESIVEILNERMRSLKVSEAQGLVTKLTSTVN